MADQTSDPGFISSLMATLKPKDNGSIPQKWLDGMLANSNSNNAQLNELITIINGSNKSFYTQSILQVRTLESISKAIGPSFKQTMIDSFKAYDKELKNSDSVKDQDKKYNDRKAQKDKEETDKNKKLVTDLSKQLSENISTSAVGKGSGELEGEAAAAAALTEIQVQPVSIAEINPDVLESLKKVFSTSIGNTATAQSTGTVADTGVGNNIISALGKGLGAGIGALGEGVGKGIGGLGKGLQTFLTSLGTGLEGLAPGLMVLADPFVAAGLGVLVLAIIGLAAALRIATPAIQAIIPFFIAVAKVIGDVFIQAIKQIAPIMHELVPLLIKIADVIGDVFIQAIKQIAPIVHELVPLLIKIADVIGKVLIETIDKIAPTILTLISAVADVIKTGFNTIKDIVSGIGSAIALPFKVIGDAVTNIITRTTDSIISLSNISGAKLRDTAGGIAAIAGSMALFGGGSLISGITGFFGGLLGGSKQSSPIDQLIALSKQTSNIDNLTNGINKLKEAMSSFGDLKTNFDPFSKFIDSVNSVNMLKLAAVATALHFSLPTNANALPGVQGPSSIINEFSNTTLPTSLASTSLASTEAAKLGKVTLSTEAKETMMETPYYKIQEAQVRLTHTMVKKLDELIATLEPVAAASTQNMANISNSTNNTTTSIVNANNANMPGKNDGNSADRDVPYIERSKYRNTMIYARGLL